MADEDVRDDLPPPAGGPADNAAGRKEPSAADEPQAATEGMQQQAVGAGSSPDARATSSEVSEEPTPPAPAAPAKRSFLAERPEAAIEVPRARLAAQSRRDFILFAAGVLAAGTGAWVLLPERAKSRLLPGPVHDALDTLAARMGLTPGRRERLLDRSLTFDDDVAEALHSSDRRVRTYDAREAQPLRNNYHGRTPTAAMLNGWALELGGLDAGGRVRLTREELVHRFALHGQVTRLVCVEGWSAIASWGGIRFADLLAAFPPAPGARWAALRSEVGLDDAGRPDPYYVSLDLDTARHPQSLLATHHAGRPLTLAHGAPLRLVAPVKLGLKNIKAITHIEYVAAEPRDYWNERGYSKYDGL